MNKGQSRHICPLLVPSKCTPAFDRRFRSSTASLLTETQAVQIPLPQNTQTHSGRLYLKKQSAQSVRSSMLGFEFGFVLDSDSVDPPA